MSCFQTEHSQAENIFPGYFVMVVMESFPCFRIIWARTLRTYIENKWTLAGLRIASFGADSQPFCVGYSHTIMDTANNCAFIIIFQLAGLLNLVASKKWLHLRNNKGTLSGGHFSLATK